MHISLFKKNLAIQHDLMKFSYEKIEDSAAVQAKQYTSAKFG